MPVPIAHIILHSKCVKEGLCQTVVFSFDENKKNKILTTNSCWFDLTILKFVRFFFVPQAEFINS